MYGDYSHKGREMKRRDALKAITTAGGGVILGVNGWPAFAAAGDLIAKPIRGLIRKDGKLWQPIHISIPSPIPNAVIKVDGVAYPRQPSYVAEQRIEMHHPMETAEQKSVVTVEGAGTAASVTVTLKPVREVLVYVLPHSHHDLGYTELQAKVEDKQVANIDRGINLARKTEGYTEGARFVWNLEVLWGAQLFLRRASPAKRAEFVQAVKRGWLALNGMYANELTGLCRPEELVQLFRYGVQLGAECGVKVDSAMLSDVPGFTWGTVTAMAQAGIRYVSAAPNWFDRIGTLMIQWQDKPFWWISPSGKEKVLLWVPWTGYAMSHIVKQASLDWVGDYQNRLDEVTFPYNISYIRWSGHGDNAEPDPDISEFFNAWGQKYEWPKFKISSTSEAFAAFDTRYGKDLPEFRGDLTPYWEDGAGSSALETALNRSAADKLVQAEAVFAVSSSAKYPAGEVAEAWRNVLLYSEHTWGAWNSVSDSENTFVTDQWRVKREFAVNADRLARELLTRALPSGATGAATHIDVHNTTSWVRTEVVRISKELSAGSDRVTDQRGNRVPSQRLNTGELAVNVKDLPAFAAERFGIAPGQAHFDGTPVTARDGVLDNGLLRARVDLKTGSIIELFHGNADNLVDTGSGGGLNEYLFLAGSNVADLQKNGDVSVTVEENGPLVAVLRIESSAPGCNRLIRTIRLASGADYLEIANLVDKKQATLNPNPGKGGPGDAFAQSGSKESVQFAFPFLIKGGQTRVNMPLSVVRPEIDQLPGACKNWLPVGRWADVSNAQYGVTWISLDAPLVEIGEISANLLGSQRDPAIWRKHILPTQKIYSWVMNNHWGTNYRAYQEGPVEFRYALHPHGRFDPAAASRLAIGMSQSLLSAAADDSSPRTEPFLSVEPDDVLVTALKPSADGKACIVSIFGASGHDRQVKLKWSAPAPTALWRSDLSELPLEPIHGSLNLAGWQLITIRAEHA
jgi:alpha-mannosidase